MEVLMVQVAVSPDFWVSRIYPEGIIERWLVRDGASVKTDQALAELRIEGAIITLKSPASGTLVIETHGSSPIEPGAVVGRIEPPKA
jgi:pyruvate/2-oxoglutarate dehydrogenase complex dihydrolipoamide acyltransferase (E2) component